MPGLKVNVFIMSAPKNKIKFQKESSILMDFLNAEWQNKWTFTVASHYYHFKKEFLHSAKLKYPVYSITSGVIS